MPRHVFYTTLKIPKEFLINHVYVLTKCSPSLFGISSSMSVSANHCFSRLLCNSRPLDIPSAYTSVLMTLPYVILSAHGLLYANIFHQYSVAIAWCIPATSGPKIYIYTVHIYYDICTSYLLILVLILVPSWSSKLMIVTKLDWLE